MSDDPKPIEWPRQLWMREREDHDQAVVTAVLSVHATVARWEGDKERDAEFHRYIDADIHESAERYWQARVNLLQAKVARLVETEDALAAAASERDRLRSQVQAIEARGSGGCRGNITAYAPTTPPPPKPRR